MMCDQSWIQIAEWIASGFAHECFSQLSTSRQNCYSRYRVERGAFNGMLINSPVVVRRSSLE